MGRKAFLEKLALFGLYGLVLVLFWIMDWPCVFVSVLGIPCPGCGMTHAWQAALQGDLAAAFGYHPMFWSVPLVFSYLLIPNHWIRYKGLCTFFLGAVGIGFLVCWLSKLL